jgi:hypothetical protein
MFIYRKVVVGPNGGKGTYTGKYDKNNNPIIQRESGSYYIKGSPRFLCCPMAFFLLDQWDVRELSIRKTADLPLQLLVGTFPRHVTNV